MLQERRNECQRSHSHEFSWFKLLTAAYSAKKQLNAANKQVGAAVKLAREQKHLPFAYP